MSRHRPVRPPDMTDFQVSQLSAYNGERSRGIVHTEEWDAKMAALQERWNEWAGSSSGIIVRKEAS
jgi:hypothetical protein